MMMHEFTERTKYQPSQEEYEYIEASYYEYDGFKDEFCQQWLKDKKSGKWEMELKFRRALDQQKAEYEAKIAEQEGLLEFYRPFCERARQAEEKLRKMSGVVKNAAKILGIEE